MRRRLPILLLLAAAGGAGYYYVNRQPAVLVLTGIVTTNDVDALLALGADCLCYLGDGIGPRAVGAVEEMSRFLRAGTNVVSTSLNQLVYQKTAPAELLGPLEAACAEGRT